MFVTIAPTADSDIKVEVWLPVGGWNQKFQAVGNGDAAGVISYDAMVEAIRRGYATSSTDTGHVGNTMAFALGHRDKYVDFGYRAVHEMTVNAKTIVEAFYGTAPVHSYWNGCSQGGRQGITEAIRYPTDFDAIIAGAPAIAHMQLHAARLALNEFVHRSSDSYIPPEKYPAIHRAALNACDALDGVDDGLIAKPSRCRFDPAILECRNGDDPSCLTAAQVETARGMYAPIVDPATGQVVSPALLQPGSELGWGRLAGPEPLPNAVEPFKYVVFKNAGWDWRAFRLSTDLPRALRVDDGVINRTDPNLQPFFDARRQAADVSRLVRSAGAAAGHHRVFQRGPEGDERVETRDGDRAVHATGREPLLGRRRPGYLRRRRRARSVDAQRPRARPHHGAAHVGHRRGPHEAAVSVPAGRAVRGQRQHRSGREFPLRGGEPAAEQRDGIPLMAAMPSR